MIILDTVSKSFGQTDVLSNVSLRIERGKFVAIMGKSGSGKSTLLNLIGGMDRPDTGNISVFGQNIVTATETQLTEYRRTRIGFIFQFFNLLPNVTVEENVMLPALLDRRKCNKDMLHELLGSVGMLEKRTAYPSELSGGEQQRVAIARALILNPPVILADEPTGSLDAQTGRIVMQLIKKMHENGKTIILVTHDSDIASWADYTVTLTGGKAQVPNFRVRKGI